MAFAASALVFMSGCEKERKLGKEFLESGKKEYSQNNEEKIIRHFFDDEEGGFFVDVGCSDWQKGSTTLYLEKNLGWKGIAIDARAELRAGWEKNRPGAKFFSYIVTDHAGTKDKFYAAGGISSTNPDHVRSFPNTKNLDVEKLEREVPTITLNQLLDEQGVKEIDFLLLDIELGEPAALRGFDIDRFEPKLICIEIGNTDVQKFIAPYFAEHNYERIDEYLPYDNVNWYYRPAAKK
jgi:FkbM family methyltransferase